MNVDHTQQESPTSNSGTPALAIKAIARDVVLIFVLTFIGGFVLGIGGIGKLAPTQAVLAEACCNLLLCTFGFAVSGAVAGRMRWPHIAVVAVLTWVLSALNIVFFKNTISQWLIQLPIFMMMVGIGGVISYAIPRSSK